MFINPNNYTFNLEKLLKTESCHFKTVIYLLLKTNTCNSLFIISCNSNQSHFVPFEHLVIQKFLKNNSLIRLLI